MQYIVILAGLVSYAAAATTVGQLEGCRTSANAQCKNIPADGLTPEEVQCVQNALDKMKPPSCPGVSESTPCWSGRGPSGGKPPRPESSGPIGLSRWPQGPQGGETIGLSRWPQGPQGGETIGLSRWPQGPQGGETIGLSRWPQGPQGGETIGLSRWPQQGQQGGDPIGLSRWPQWQQGGSSPPIGLANQFTQQRPGGAGKNPQLMALFAYLREHRKCVDEQMEVCKKNLEPCTGTKPEGCTHEKGNIVQSMLACVSNRPA